MAVDCATCGANSFESLNGFKYCTRCQRQSQDTSDMVVNCSYFRGETREIMNGDNYNTLSNPPWTSFEAFNKVLVDHVRTLQKNCPNELPKNFKSIVISVWMSYLEKCVMAFGDLLTHRKVMAILYISLRLAKTNIYASDLSRWVVARDMTYVNSTCILPINWNFYYHDYWLLNCQAPPSSVGIIKSAGEIAEFIEVDLDAKPDLVALMRRYLVDMNLPLDIVRFVTSNDKFSNSLAEYADRPLSQCARYEVHVLTLILVALKRLFVLDGYTEKVISDAIEAVDHDEVLFDFDAWENWTLFRVQLLEGYHFPLRDQSALRIKDVRVLSRFSKYGLSKVNADLVRRNRPPVGQYRKFGVGEVVTFNPSQKQVQAQVCSMRVLSDATLFASQQVIQSEEEEVYRFMKLDFTRKRLSFFKCNDLHNYEYSPIGFNHSLNQAEIGSVMQSLPTPIRMILKLMCWLTNENLTTFYTHITRVEHQLFTGRHNRIG